MEGQADKMNRSLLEEIALIASRRTEKGDGAKNDSPAGWSTTTDKEILTPTTTSTQPAKVTSQFQPV